MKRLSIGITVFLLCVLNANAQDVHFSQYNFAPLSLNPANAGVQSDIRANANYRSQWSSIGYGYNTIGLSCDMSAFKSSSRPAWMGIGINVLNDKAGVGLLSTLMSNLSLSAVVASGKSSYSAGLQFGYSQKSVNSGNFSWDSQFDGFKYNPALPDLEYYNNQNFHFVTMGGGFNWYYSKTEHYMTSNDELKANMGIAAYHFNGPRQSFTDLTDEKLFTKLVFYGNYSIGVHGKKFCFLPSYYVAVQGPQKEIMVGNLFKFIITEASHFTHIKKACALSLGGFLRVKDAWVAQMLFEYDRYALGVAYDMNTSRLSNATKSFGAYEVTFRFHTFRSGSGQSRI